MKQGSGFFVMGFGVCILQGEGLVELESRAGLKDVEMTVWDIESARLNSPWTTFAVRI